MRQQTLLSYFESEIQQRNALDAVTRRGWLVPSENLNLYDSIAARFRSDLQRRGGIGRIPRDL